MLYCASREFIIILSSNGLFFTFQPTLTGNIRDVDDDRADANKFNSKLITNGHPTKTIKYQIATLHSTITILQQ